MISESELQTILGEYASVVGMIGEALVQPGSEVTGISVSICMKSPDHFVGGVFGIHFEQEQAITEHTMNLVNLVSKVANDRI